jgi:hypothetical protein
MSVAFLLDDRNPRSSPMRIVGSSLLIGIVASFALVPLAAAKPPAWDTRIKTPKRFQVLTAFDNAAVLDRETGLVWEKMPSTGVGDWYDRLDRCYKLEVGGRKGWRVPTIEELASLVDTAQGSPSLPLGHPFLNVQPYRYWSATTRAPNVGNVAWSVDFTVGSVIPQPKTNNGQNVWCVRGGQGVDGSAAIP